LGSLTLGEFLPLRRRVAVKHLAAIEEDKANGPDQMPGRILKACSKHYLFQ